MTSALSLRQVQREFAVLRSRDASGWQLFRLQLPKLILADEPTGQLDTVTGSNIVALLREIVHKTGITVIIASHDPKVEEAADCVYELRNGQLVASSLQT